VPICADSSARRRSSLGALRLTLRPFRSVTSAVNLEDSHRVVPSSRKQHLAAFLEEPASVSRYVVQFPVPAVLATQDQSISVASGSIAGPQQTHG